MKCPYCSHEISDTEIGSFLGKKAKGVKKNFSDAERKRRSERLIKMNKARAKNKLETNLEKRPQTDETNISERLDSN